MDRTRRGGSVRRLGLEPRESNPPNVSFAGPAVYRQVISGAGFGGTFAGSHDPAAACGGAEQRVCFVIRDARWTDANLQFHPISFEPFFGVSWQDDGFSCFGDLPVQPSHWTALKVLYR